MGGSDWIMTSHFQKMWVWPQGSGCLFTLYMWRFYIVMFRLHWFDCGPTSQMQDHHCAAISLWYDKRDHSSCQPAMITAEVQAICNFPTKHKTLAQRWPTVCNAGPASDQHCINVMFTGLLAHTATCIYCYVIPSPVTRTTCLAGA